MPFCERRKVSMPEAHLETVSGGVTVTVIPAPDEMALLEEIQQVVVDRFDREYPHRAGNSALQGGRGCHMHQHPPAPTDEDFYLCKFATVQAIASSVGVSVNPTVAVFVSDPRLKWWASALYGCDHPSPNTRSGTVQNQYPMRSCAVPMSDSARSLTVRPTARTIRFRGGERPVGRRQRPRVLRWARHESGRRCVSSTPRGGPGDRQLRPHIPRRR